MKNLYNAFRTIVTPGLAAAGLIGLAAIVQPNHVKAEELSNPQYQEMFNTTYSTIERIRDLNSRLKQKIVRDRVAEKGTLGLLSTLTENQITLHTNIEGYKSGFNIGGDHKFTVNIDKECLELTQRRFDGKRDLYIEYGDCSPENGWGNDSYTEYVITGEGPGTEKSPKMNLDDFVGRKGIINDAIEDQRRLFELAYKTSVRIGNVFDEMERDYEQIVAELRQDLVPIYDVIKDTLTEKPITDVAKLELIGASITNYTLLSASYIDKSQGLGIELKAYGTIGYAKCQDPGSIYITRFLRNDDNTMITFSYTFSEPTDKEKDLYGDGKRFRFLNVEVRNQMFPNGIKFHKSGSNKLTNLQPELISLIESTLSPELSIMEKLVSEACHSEEVKPEKFKRLLEEAIEGYREPGSI